MRSIIYILVSILILTSCSKSEVQPEHVIRFEFEDQIFEKKLHRFYKVGVESDLYANGYGFSIDSLEYLQSYHFAVFSLKAFVYYHPDSTNYSNEYSSLLIELINKSDSTSMYFSSEICSPSTFELVIEDFDWIDLETGTYSGRFSGELCDSSQTNKLNIISGNIIRALL